MRIIALVIGNNDYPEPDKLENAVNTTGWAPGLYAVRAIIKGEVLSEKIIVK